jgi:hypothetical protein
MQAPLLKVLNLLNENNFLSTINSVFRPTSKSCLDHIFYTCPLDFEKVGLSLVVNISSTDHYHLFYIIDNANEMATHFVQLCQT